MCDECEWDIGKRLLYRDVPNALQIVPTLHLFGIPLFLPMVKKVKIASQFFNINKTN